LQVGAYRHIAGLLEQATGCVLARAGAVLWRVFASTVAATLPTMTAAPTEHATG